MKSIPEQPQFFATLAHEFPTVPAHRIAYVGLDLIKCARAQNRIAVNLCNIPKYQATYDRRAAAIRKKLYALLLVLQDNGAEPVAFITGGDPRGAALKLVLPSGQTNDFGREGYCVPEGK